jgi:hypothetical protein
MTGQNPPAVSTCHKSQDLIGGAGRVPAAPAIPKWASSWTRFGLAAKLAGCEKLQVKSWQITTNTSITCQSLTRSLGESSCSFQLPVSVDQKPHVVSTRERRISAPSPATSSSPRGSPRLDFDRGVCVWSGLAWSTLVFLSISATLNPLQIPPLLVQESAWVRQLETCVCVCVCVSEETPPKRRVCYKRLVRFPLVPCSSRQTRWMFRGFRR